MSEWSVSSSPMSRSRKLVDGLLASAMESSEANHLVKVLTKNDEKLKMAHMGKCDAPLACAILPRTLDYGGNCIF